ncbi:MAG: arginine--tRNA ligase [Elusimicrobia bacterium]|jgi:arginyl-tRNA synthetase|nr:arginine--tRNA ligase [Elusimicrobiota bacterium]
MYEIKLRNRLSELAGNKEVKLDTPPDKIPGDLSTNAAMVYGLNPRDIAGRLEELDYVESAGVVGPGFINITLTSEIKNREIAEIVKAPSEYAKGIARGDILFEMVSSNPTGPLHIGHGRGAVIGDALARMYGWLGYKVRREYYVNDTGRQITLLGESIYNIMNGAKVPDDGYKGDYIKDIAAGLESSLNREECKNRASEIILDTHFDVLKEFGVSYDNKVYETDLINSGKVNEAIEFLKKKGLTYKKDGALWFKTSVYGDDRDRVLVKKDGEFTYFASDCAYHKDKGRRHKELMNIWGADHHGYIARLDAFWEAAGFKGNKGNKGDKKLNIVLYQLVNLKRAGELVSMSTRAGEFVTLKEVMDEVGVDAARFFLLMRNSDTPLDFDVDLAKQENKSNPVYYVQYSHARISSVFKKAGVTPADINPADALNLGKEEDILIKVTAHFPYILSKCVQLNAPHLLTEYLRDAAAAFHKYYDTVKIVGSRNQAARLTLLLAVKEVIKNGLHLVGVSAPEKM